MANYYMLGGDGKEYGPVSASQLRQWAAEGRANLQTQVRPTEGGAWSSLGAVPELNAPAGYAAAAAANPGLASVLAQTTNVTTDDSTALVKRLAAILASASGWIRFFAILLFIYGGLMAISIIYTILCWIPIWLGVVFWGIATKARLAAQTGAEADLAQSLDKVRFAFKLYGIVTIVFLVLAVILVAFMLLGMFAGLAGAMHNP